MIPYLILTTDISNSGAMVASGVVIVIVFVLCALVLLVEKWQK